MVNAVAVLNSNEGVCGTIYFAEEGDGSTTVTGSLSGLKPGLHGFHVHTLGDTTKLLTSRFLSLDQTPLLEGLLLSMLILMILERGDMSSAKAREMLVAE